MAAVEGRRSQFLRGVLDLCLLAVIEDEPVGWILLALGLAGGVCITIMWVGGHPGRRPRPGEA